MVNGSSSIESSYEWEYDNKTNEFSVPVFGINSTAEADSESLDTLSDQEDTMVPLTISTTFKDTLACQGSITTHTCKLSLTPIIYDVVINNGLISLKDPHWQNDTVMSL